MEVWILYGDDIESNADLAHEVRRFKEEAARLNIDLKVHKPADFDLLISEDTRDSILIHGKPVPLPDVVYPYFNHGDHSYFNLAILRQLERSGVLVYNNAETIEKVRDKLHTHQVIAEKGLPSPDTMLAKFPIDDNMMEIVEKRLGFPLIVKTLDGALGTGVFLMENAKSFQDLMNMISQTSPDIQLIFQKFVAASKGRDLRLFTVDGEVIASMERRAKEGDFKANYSAGGSVHEFKPDALAIDIALKTAGSLNIQIGGIDLLFLEGGGYTVCEANTFPGFKGLEKASGVNVPEKIFQSMEKRLRAHKLGKQTQKAISTVPSIVTPARHTILRWYDAAKNKWFKPNNMAA